MAGDFDDHANVVVLDWMVKRLIVEHCRQSSNPAEALERWKAAVAEHTKKIESFAFSENTRTDVSLNAISVLAQFGDFMKEVGEDLG